MTQKEKIAFAQGVEEGYVKAAERTYCTRSNPCGDSASGRIVRKMSNNLERTKHLLGPNHADPVQ
ncbi:MAG: hypothetical protein WB683_06660 [Candidatus Sulfotelmatobacter sp.]